MTSRKIIICPSCKSKKSKFISKHKPLTDEDLNYFKNLSIYECSTCKLGFSHPMPKFEILDEYYDNIYRKPGKPHFIENPKNIDIPNWQIAQFSYINQFINLSKIKTIADIGCGYGFLLRKIREENKSIRLIGIDSDSKTIEYLKKYNIEIYPDVDSYTEDYNKNNADLIISSHSIEHFTDPNHFFKIIKKVIKPNGKLFLELPNTPLTKDKYLKRPYDGSHLLYFNKNSLMKSVKMNK